MGDEPCDNDHVDGVRSFHFEKIDNFWVSLATWCHSSADLVRLDVLLWGVMVMCRIQSCVLGIIAKGIRMESMYQVIGLSRDVYPATFQASRIL
jgi:hypothetical protein